MKKSVYLPKIAALLAAVCLLSGCQKTEESAVVTAESHPSAQVQENEKESHVPSDTVGISFVDALGYEVHLESWERVVSLYGSFAEAWTLAGGSLVGVTDDAVKEREMVLPEDVIFLGGNKEPNLEEVIASAPDFLILSADAPGQVKLHDALMQAKVAHAYFRVDTFADYQNMMELFCEMTNRSDLYQKHVDGIAKEIEHIKSLVAGQKQPTVLYLRAFSTGVKAKADDNQTGVMLKELGANNIAAQSPSLLEELSMEEVIAQDPDFILMTVMGADTQKGLDYMKAHVENNPAWSELSAVKNGRYILLPKDLFHYKPNARWGESYAYLAKILYPELATQIDA